MITAVIISRAIAGRSPILELSDLSALHSTDKADGSYANVGFWELLSPAYP